MKEVLAENRFSLTKPLFYEGLRAVSAASYGKTVKKLLIGVAVLWLALSVWTVRQSGSLSWALAELAVLAAAALWLAVLLPRSRAKHAWRTLEEQGRAEAERITRFYGDRLEVDCLGSVTRVPYAKLRKTIQSDRLLVLIAEDQTGILIKKDAFTLGSEGSVLDLIEEAEKEEQHD